jgi:glycosyltransferase involved in cell wall biosynthesis
VNVVSGHRRRQVVSPHPARRKPRILVLVTLSEVGGAQSYVSDLVPGLTPTFDVVVAAHGDGPLADRVRRSGARFVRLRFLRRNLSPLDLAALFEIWLLCLRLRPEVMHANSSKAGAIGRVAALLAGVRHRVFTTHGWAFAAAEGRQARLYELVERALRPITSAVICVSEREHRRGVEARACPQERTFVIPNAVDLTRFGPHEGGPESGPVEVVSVGRLAAPKDFSTLLEALARLEPGTVALRILGDGPDRPRLAERCTSLGLDACVHFEGTVEDVASWLARADVFVLSSRSEGMPMSVLEAMAAGLPVIASDVGGMRELVDERRGILVAPGDPAALAQALGDLVLDPARRRRLGGAGRAAVAAGFALEDWHDRHGAVYARLLGTAATAAGAAV